MLLPFDFEQPAPFAYESLTIDNTAAGIGFTAATYAPAAAPAALRALITLETGPIRYRLDGTAPTATEGHLLSPGDPMPVLIVGSQAIGKFLAIRTTGTSGTLKVTYLR